MNHNRFEETLIYVAAILFIFYRKGRVGSFRHTRLNSAMTQKTIPEGEGVVRQKTNQMIFLEYVYHRM